MTMIERRMRQEGEISITLAAGEEKNMPRACRSFMCISATTSGVVLIGFDQEASKQIRQGMGDSVGYDEPDVVRLFFKNTSGNAETIVISTSFGTITDNRFNLVGGTVPISEVYPDTIAPQPKATIAATSHLDFAADPLRRLLTIYNDSATDTLWLRDQSGTTLIGEPIGPKQSWRGTFIGAGRIRNGSGNAVDCYVTYWS